MYIKECMALLEKIEDKIAGYNQKGSNNNNYKGPGKRSYSADHKAAAKKMKTLTKCSRCGSTKDLQRAEVKGSNGTRYVTMCRSCHSKYDGAHKNFSK